MKISDRIRLSALWAAYGDAMGFMTELAGASMVRTRTGRTHINSLIPWKRRIGGKFGVEVALPAGCYSDDTQLRLATSRAIRGNGDFDVEAFANVELPVWLSYALGGGNATKIGAASLSRPGSKWHSNFFKDAKRRYVDCGGNGAAMRIQPHVWASPSGSSDEKLLRDIVRNAITTHGHARGFVGAAFHGMCVKDAMDSGQAPAPDRLIGIAENLQSISHLIVMDRELESMWLPFWSRESRMDLEVSVYTACSEIIEIIRVLKEAKIIGRIAASEYKEMTTLVDGLNRDKLGSGTITSAIAAMLAFWSEGNPLMCAELATNLLGSDTDTIATMACAIAGCCWSDPPPEQPLDSIYIANEATRLAQIRDREKTFTFKYPDLLYWKSPRTSLDCVGTRGNKWYLSGLGEITRWKTGPAQVQQKNIVWTWFELRTGQRALIKHRTTPYEIQDDAFPLFANNKDKIPQSEVNDGSSWHRTVEPTTKRLSVDSAADDVIKSGFDPKIIGEWLLRFAGESKGVDDAIAFAAIAAKAHNARQEHKRRS